MAKPGPGLKPGDRYSSGRLKVLQPKKSLLLKKTLLIEENMSEEGLICAGAGSIAKFLGVKTGQVYYWASNDYLPTFRIGTTLCADKATLRNFIAEKMNGSSFSSASSECTTSDK